MQRILVTLILTLIVIMATIQYGDFTVNAATPRGVISISFDDGWQNQYTYAYPVLQKYGMPATYYVITSVLGDGNHLSVSQLKTLQASGSEIASHSVTHPHFTSLTNSQIAAECLNSKQYLQSQGLTVNNFAYPYGDQNTNTDSIVSQYYRSARLAWAPGVMSLPYSQFLVPAWPVESSNIGQTSQLQCLQNAKNQVDKIVAANGWGVFFFHKILPNDTTDIAEFDLNYFTQFISYVSASGARVLTVNQALDLAGGTLSVSVSPTSASLVQGGRQDFTSIISGGLAPYSYQWFNRAPGASAYSLISGATAPSYSFVTSPSTMQGAWAFLVQVTDNTGKALNSSAAIATVNAPPPLIISLSPSSCTMDSDQSAIFTATATGGSGNYFSYQWYVDGNPQTGAGSSTYNYVPTSTGSHSVKATVTDSQGSTAVSTASPVTVNSAIEKPSIAASDESIERGQSSSLALTTLTTGTPPYTYLWLSQAPDATAFTPISGATKSTYDFVTSSSTIYGVWRFKIQVNDAVEDGPVTSNAILVNVIPDPIVSVSPAYWTMDVGQSVMFTASASGGSGSYPTYAWYIGGTAVTGTTTATFMYSPTSHGSLSITATVTDSLGFVSQQSNAVFIKVNYALTVNVAPSAIALDAGQVQKFTATASGGTGSLTYQWYVGGAPVPGETASAFNYTASGGSQTIYCKVTDMVNASVNSTPVQVSVNGPSPTPTSTATPTITTNNPTLTPTQVPSQLAISTPVPTSISQPTPTSTVPEINAIGLLVLILGLFTFTVTLKKTEQKRMFQ